jgi:integrase
VTIGPHGPLTPDMARKEAIRLLGQMVLGTNPRQVEKNSRLKGVTLADAYRDYLDSRELSENTRHDYAKAMRTAFADWQDKPLTAINRNIVEARFNEVSEKGKAQANQQFRFLRALLNFAMEKYSDSSGEPIIPSNPCNRLTALKKWHRIERRTRYIEPPQLKTWFTALTHGPEDSDYRRTVKDCCAFILLTGCREQEAGRLEWSGVDFGKRTVTFRQTKNHKTHTLPVGTWLLALLERRRAAAGDSPYVFPAGNQSGHLMHHRKAVAAIAEQSGIPFCLHDLRRTFASIVSHHLERTLSQYTVKRLLNHASGGDVTAGYVQHSVEDLRGPMQAVESFVLKCAGLEPSASIVKPPRKHNLKSG